MRNPIVWIIKEQQLRGGESSVPMNFLPAEQYGEIRFITRADIPLHPNSTTREVWEDDVAKFVEHYDEARDYIIPTGQPAAIFMVGSLLAKAGKTPRLLVWRREDNHYRVMV